MSDSYSYSYTGSNPDDYSYSYSYSDSETEEKAQAPVQPAVAAAAAAAEAKKKGGKAAPAAPPSDSYDYSYSYSGSYTESSSPHRPRPPRSSGAAGAAVQKKGNEDDTGDYSYSYSYSDSYSDDDSESAAAAGKATPAPRRGGPTPTPAEVAASRKGKGAAHGPSSPPPARQPTSVPPAGAAGGGAEDTGDYSYSYSYSYSYPETGKKPAAAGAGGGNGQPSDSYYAYSDDYGSYSYTDSYSYTGDGSYYYSSASGSGDGSGFGGEAKKQRKETSASPSYYYSDAYSDSYYYSDDHKESGSYYYTGDSYAYSEEAYDDADYYYSSYNDSHPPTSEPYDYSDDDGEDYSSYYYSATDSAASKPASSTTSSYGYTGSHPSVMSVTETDKARETVVLRAPAQDTPHAPPAPKRCFVAPKSVEDGVWAFLQRLLRMQQVYEARRTAAAAATTSGAAAAAAGAPASFLQRTAAPGGAAAALAGEEAAGGKDASKAEEKTKRRWRRSKSKKSTAKANAGADAADEETLDDAATPAASFVPTKENCFSERSLRIAFRVLRLNHLERTEALKNAPVPLPMATMADIYNTCVAARAKEKVAQAFLAHDTYRSGELSLRVMGGLLRRLGLGTSPTLEGFRISLAASTDATPEMVMNVERLVQAPAPARAASEDREGEKEGGDETPATEAKTLQWEVTPVYVSRIIRKNAAAKKSTPVLWEHNAIYMGRHVIVRNVTSEALFERLKTYIEAATYLCVLTNVFSIHDAERGTVTVQYPQFVRSVLLATPPSKRRHAAPPPPTTMKLLAIENLFRAVFHPMAVLYAFETGRGFPRYLHDWAVESTLRATNDTEEKRRRNVVPSISADNAHFLPAPPTRPPTEARLSFVLQKVRVPGKPPAHARCFCLVSAITPADVFLPAIEVPVHKIVKSTKDPDGFTWVFYAKKQKKDAVLHFAGPAVDRIYVECCYETQELPLKADEAGEAADATVPDSAVATVWCAGYAVFAVEGATTAALPVATGSLLHDEPTPAAPAAPSPPHAAAAEADAAAGKKKGKSGKGVFGFLSKFSRHKRRLAPTTASNIKIEVVKVKRPITGVEKLPARFIAFQRHLPMIAQLRPAVEVVGKDTDHALQALRHQAVRYIFSVAADAALLDQLCTLWSHRTKHWSKTERKDATQQHVQLLSCVAALYALNNCCAGSKNIFARALVKKKALQMSLDEEAPLLPVRV